VTGGACGPLGSPLVSQAAVGGTRTGGNNEPGDSAESFRPSTELILPLRPHMRRSGAPRPSNQRRTAGAPADSLGSGFPPLRGMVPKERAPPWQDSGALLEMAGCESGCPHVHPSMWQLRPRWPASPRLGDDVRRRAVASRRATM
jgi:hypothetical protein